MGERELQLVAAQDRLVSPPRRFTRRDAVAPRCTFPASPSTRSCSRIEGAIIGFLIAVPVGPAAALCIRRSITVGAVAGYLTGIGAALGDAVFGAVAAFGLSFVEDFVARHEAWLRGIGGVVLVVMGWATMRHRLRTVGDPGGRRPRAPGRDALPLRQLELLHHRVQSAHA